MAINFANIYFLLLLIPAIGLVIWWIKTQKRVRGNRKYAIAAIRMVLFTCLILAISGLILLFPSNSKTIVFVVDRSTSMNNDTKITQFIEDAIKTKEDDDKYAIISFGEGAVVEQPLSTTMELAELGGIVNQHTTNIEEGLRLASSMVPTNSGGKIVLITDGLETSGNALDEIKYAKDRKIEVDVHYLTQDIGDEVLVKSLSVPNKLYKNEEFEETVVIESTIQTNGTLIFYEGNKVIDETPVEIEKGINRFTYQTLAEKEGFHKFRVQLIADKDNLQINNQGYAFAQIKSTPKVLVIEGHKGSADNLYNALTANQVDVDVIEPALLPKEFADYKQYATIILSDLQATQLSDAEMKRIQTAVRDLGIGLIMAGGGNSFGLGGWYKTPIEEALPVDMEVRNKKTNPSLALMLVIDKSGSMVGDGSGVSKMELAKEGAIRSSEMLTEQDQIGVIAFDGTPWLTVETQPVTNLDEIHEKISGISAGGGTEIYSALRLAYNELLNTEAQIKHIILLTDGQSGRNSNYQNLLANVSDDHITVTTVAIGGGSDTNLLNFIANVGNGRYYYCDNPSTIPQIFSKETALAGRTYVVEKPQIPIKNRISDFSVLGNSLPVINAYIATTPKKTANQVLISQDNDPILATWQYGLGRAVAWMSDIEGKWASDWVNWNNSSTFWSQVVGWTYPQIAEGSAQTKVNMNGLKGTIDVKITTGTMPQDMEATIINDKMESKTIKLKPVAPDRLQGDFIADGEGTYVIQINQKENEQIIASQTEGVNISYSPEYAILSGGKEKVDKFINASAGKLIEEPKQVFSDSSVTNWEQRDISNILVVLATILLVIDIAIRRINFSFAIKERLSRFRERTKTEIKTVKRTSDLESLISKKESYREVKEVNKPSQVNQGRRVNQVKETSSINRKKSKQNKDKSVTKVDQPANNRSSNLDNLDRLLSKKNNQD